MHTKALPYIGLLSLLWGTNIVASRLGIGEFDPYLFIGLRLFTATFFFALIFLTQVFVFRTQKWPSDPSLWGNAAISGIIGVAIPMSLFILSLQYQSSGMTSIFVTTGPVFVVIAAHFFLPDEPMTRSKGMGVILALAGSLFLALRGESGLADMQQASSLGFVLVVIALLSDSANVIFVRRRMKGMDPIAVTGVRLLTGTVITCIIALLFSDYSLAKVTGAGVFSLLYAGLIGALAGQFLAFVVQRRFGATAFSLTAYLIPVVATTFGVLLLDEIVTWGMGFGVILIGGGIYLINR